MVRTSLMVAVAMFLVAGVGCRKVHQWTTDDEAITPPKVIGKWIPANTPAEQQPVVLYEFTGDGVFVAYLPGSVPNTWKIQSRGTYKFHSGDKLDVELGGGSINLNWKVLRLTDKELDVYNPHGGGSGDLHYVRHNVTGPVPLDPASVKVEKKPEPVIVPIPVPVGSGSSTPRMLEPATP